jgi:hypothetical protein
MWGRRVALPSPTSETNGRRPLARGNMQDSVDNLVRAFNLASTGNLAELRPLIIDRRVAVDVVRPDGLFKGYTLLHAAASKGHVEVVEFLLSAGASPDVLNAQGKTALALARDKNHLAIVAILERASRTSANPPDAAPPPTTAEAPVPAAHRLRLKGRPRARLLLLRSPLPRRPWSQTGRRPTSPSPSPSWTCLAALLPCLRRTATRRTWGSRERWSAFTWVRPSCVPPRRIDAWCMSSPNAPPPRPLPFRRWWRFAAST